MRNNLINVLSIMAGSLNTMPTTKKYKKGEFPDIMDVFPCLNEKKLIRIKKTN